MSKTDLDAPLRPWTICETDYPADGQVSDQLRFLLRYAILAPSGHNTQPWLFAVRDRAIHLYADRARALPVVDPDDRALIISCGAALETLRLAARHFGHRAAVTMLPDPADEDLLARVSVEPGEPPTADEEQLFAAIPMRHSTRQAFEGREPPAGLAERLRADAADEGVTLHLVAGAERAAIAELIAEGDRIQMADKRFRRELASWVHPNRSRSHDGMRGYGFGFGDLMAHLGPVVIRSFDLGDGQAAKDRALAEGSPLLGIFLTNADGTADRLAAGQALQRVLLRAQAAGLCASFLNQPVEVPALRPRVAELVAQPGVAQLVVRLGYGPRVPAEPRRAVEEVLVEEPDREDNGRRAEGDVRQDCG